MAGLLVFQGFEGAEFQDAVLFERDGAGRLELLRAVLHGFDEGGVEFVELGLLGFAFLFVFFVGGGFDDFEGEFGGGLQGDRLFFARGGAGDVDF